MDSFLCGQRVGGATPPALPPGDERSAENSQAAGRDGRGESGGYQ